MGVTAEEKMIPPSSTHDFYSDELDSEFKDDLQTTSPVQTESQAKSPGSVRTKGMITVHTKAAHRLVHGRRKTKEAEHIIGLLQFSSKVNIIYSAAEGDDPYADMRLNNIYEAIIETRKIIEENSRHLINLLGKDDNIEIFPSTSIEPMKVPLEFRTPFGYLGAQLISSFDSLLLKALAARHSALIFDDDWKTFVNYPARKIRHCFILADGFKLSGASRDDFAANNARATEALNKYGDLPEDVLKGTNRCPLAPKIKNHPDLASD